MNLIMYGFGFTSGLIALHIAQSVWVYRLRKRDFADRKEAIEKMTEFLNEIEKSRCDEESKEVH